MSKYQVKSLTGQGDILNIDRIGEDKLSIEIGDKKITMFTEDLAAVVKMELPKDRAQELFAEMEEKSVDKGKVAVVVKAQKDIKRGEMVAFTLDITRYLDINNQPTGVRTAKHSGIIF
jgi:hypothetical protein